MENKSPSRSFFSSSASDHLLISPGHVITSDNIWIGSVGSTRRASSAVTSPGSARSPPPDDEAEMARRKLNRILHLRSPLSSIENNMKSHRVVGPSAKVVPPMKVGTKEDDVLVMDAVPIQFARGMEKQRGSPLAKPQKSEEEKRVQGPRGPQITPPAISKSPTISPLSKERTPKKDEAVKIDEKLAQGLRLTPISPPTISKSPMTSPLSMEKTPEKEEADKTEEKLVQGPQVSKFPQMPPLTPATSPSWEEKTPKRAETGLTKRDFVWSPTLEEAALITKVLYGTSDKKRLSVFSQICPE